MMTPVETQIQSLLQDLSCALVTDPKSVTVHTELLHRTIEADIQVTPIDFGLIVGKQGKTFTALANIFRMFCKKHGFEGKLNRLQEPGERQLTHDAFVSREWPIDVAEKLLLRIGQAVFTEPEAVEVHRNPFNGRIRFTLALSGNEPALLVERMHEHIDHLIGAIARVAGGIANVDIKVKEATERTPKQPPSAAGRYTKEVR